MVVMRWKRWRLWWSGGRSEVWRWWRGVDVGCRWRPTVRMTGDGSHGGLKWWPQEWMRYQRGGDEDGCSGCQLVAGRKSSGDGAGKIGEKREIAYQADDLDAYDSDCDDFSIAKAVLMADLSSYESDVLSKCPKPKRKRDATWFKDKVLLVKAQGSGKVLNEEELEFLADLRVAKAKAVLMADLSSYESNVLSKVPHSENTYNVMLNQTVQEMPYSEQTHLEKEAKNIDKEIALEKIVKELDNIVCKMGQSAQTVHMLTKPQVFYDNNLKQALGFLNSFYLKKAQQIRPMLYDGSVITKKTNVISIADSEETLILEEQNFGKRFILQKELSDEQAFWLQTSHPNTDQSASLPVKIEAPRELPKISLVNTSLKKLKHGQFDNVVKKRITPDALTEGEWGFKHP
nr:hypothetical protein [Tanacetum cinerariifolium]